MRLDLAATLRRAATRIRRRIMLTAGHAARAAFAPDHPAPAAPEAVDRPPATTAPAAPPEGPIAAALRLAPTPAAAALGFLRRPQPGPEVAPGARWETRSFACDAGTRDYRLYVPASGTPRGLLLMLHGCKQDPDDFAIGTGMNRHAERAGLVVAYPRQTRRANGLACWNWYAPDHQRRGAGEPAILAGIAEALAAEFGIDPERVMVAGLSAGGAMASVLGATYPDRFGAVGVHSGLPYGAASDAASAVAAMRGESPAAPPVLGLRTIVFHGDADRTVHPWNAATILSGAGDGATSRETGATASGRAWRRETFIDAEGRTRFELWLVAGAGHAWSGGNPAGSYADPDGPDASAEMVRFLLDDEAGSVTARRSSRTA